LYHTLPPVPRDRVGRYKPHHKQILSDVGIVNCSFLVLDEGGGVTGLLFHFRTVLFTVNNFLLQLVPSSRQCRTVLVFKIWAQFRKPKKKNKEQSSVW
jgi:hypothetical protein